MIEKASGRRAMQPLIEASRASAEKALMEGRIPDAKHDIERLRAADPTHPALPTLDRWLSAPPQAPDSGPGQESNEFALGGPQGEAYGTTPAFGGLSSEPGSLDPSFQPSSDLASLFPDEGGPHAPGAGSFGFDDIPAEPDAHDPSAPPTRDMFLPLDEGPGSDATSMLSPEVDEEEVRAADREIGALIKQGDEAAKKGDRDQAIEIWSRVFLIDINNSDAVTRIERARHEIADDSRLVAECLKKGLESYEAGDRDAARKFFLQARALDHNEPTAGLYLQRIESGEGEKAAPGAAGEDSGRPAPPAGTDDARAPAPMPRPRRRRPRGVAPGCHQRESSASSGVPP
jgi:tetratricopeptide (TPR) repeat protein